MAELLIEMFLLFLKIIALLAILGGAVYLLIILATIFYLISLQSRERNPVPTTHICDGCKHLVRTVGEGKHRTWYCGYRSNWAWDPEPRGADLMYCGDFEPRVKGGETDD